MNSDKSARLEACRQNQHEIIESLQTAFGPMAKILDELCKRSRYRPLSTNEVDELPAVDFNDVSAAVVRLRDLAREANLLYVEEEKPLHSPRLTCSIRANVLPAPGRTPKIGGHQSSS
jgi:hypothetical protein